MNDSMKAKKHYFIILAHTEPELLCQVIRRIDAPNHYFLVHIDKKSQEKWNLQDFQKQNVKVYRKMEIRWGGINQVLVKLVLLREALLGGADYCHFISGQDFMTTSPKKFDDYFCQKGEHYHGIFSFVPNESLSHLKQKRMDIWCFYDLFDRRKWSILSKLCRIIEEAEYYLIRTGLPLRKKFDFDYYKGEAWFSVDYALGTEIVSFCEHHPDFIKRFRHTCCSDESFFHTVAMQSSYKETILPQTITYCNWSRKRKSPEILTDNDYQDIIKSGCLFCRKVSLKDSQALIELLQSNTL